MNVPGYRKRPPLTCKEVKRGLKQLGFVAKDQRGSHQNWVPAHNNTPFRKVTVDCAKAPFGHDLIRLMARQAGVSKAEFYRACLS